MLLQVDQLSKHFGGLPAVDGVSMATDDGEILAVVGPNGAGKSTLLKLIVGLEKPSQGSIKLAGSEIGGMSPHRVRHRGVAVVQQTPRVFPNMTVLENAAVGALFGRPGSHRDQGAALDEAGELLTYLGLGDRVHHDVGSLNLHEQRLLEMARAISGRPQLLLLDEVMAGLNESELETSIDLVRTIRDRFGATVIWVEHVMKAVLALAERVIVLDFGKVLTSGSPETVMRDPAVIEAYLGTQGSAADA